MITLHLIENTLSDGSDTWDVQVIASHGNARSANGIDSMMLHAEGQLAAMDLRTAIVAAIRKYTVDQVEIG